MKQFLDISYWRAVSRNPTAITGLMVDLAPIVGVFVWHWGAAALVLLYWLENIVIGFATAGRILLSAIGKDGVKGVFGGAWLVAFFTVHYGLFCLAHGCMLLAFITGDNSWSSGSSLEELIRHLIQGALSFGLHMDWILALIAVWQAMMLVDYLRAGAWKGTEPREVMFAPYGRIIVLHIGAFIVGGTLQALGSPMPGLLVLVLGRALWGLNANMGPRKVASQAVPAAS